MERSRSEAELLPRTAVPPTHLLPARVAHGAEQLRPRRPGPPPRATTSPARSAYPISSFCRGAGPALSSPRLSTVTWNARKAERGGSRSSVRDINPLRRWVQLFPNYIGGFSRTTSIAPVRVRDRKSLDSCYEPGPAFEEVKEEAMLDISPTDSTEFWLIQWPKDQLDVLDFHGKELSLKLNSDGNLGSLESSSGKSYELVSFAAQKPDATVFLPSGSETKPVGKISRRVSLVHYPKPEELAKPSFGSLTPSSKKSAGSKKTMSRFISASKNRSSQGSSAFTGPKECRADTQTQGEEKG
ncbi:unnamed protein product [Miscanthus lutarioriparius]|uniref:Uncharacterized protein n=1 Tax=Miscanthus lutarioriparius TaxID=422564 RepID=A0A811NWC5_9POAL|nr:unnamed protein product [Miscanthus lutarioriparius]